MKEQVIAKIKAEMKTDTSPYVQVIGEMLLKHINAHPADAEKILSDDKTISKSLDAMKSEARINQKNGCAVLTDEEGFSIVLKYFGIDTQYNSPGDPDDADFATSLDAYM